MTATAVQTWTGRSDEIAVPLLGAEFWTNDREVMGAFGGFRDQKVGGPAFKLTLDTPISIDGEDVEVVEVPSLTGIRNALQSLKQKGYQSKIGDQWRVTCVGIKLAKKEGFSNSPEFQIDVMRK
jgi:hypothetical protein